MADKKKQPSNPKKEVEKIFRRMAAQLDQAGDRCRIKKGGSVCVAFDATAEALRFAPRYFDPSAFHGMPEESKEEKLGEQPTDPSSATELTSPDAAQDPIQLAQASSAKVEEPGDDRS